MVAEQEVVTPGAAREVVTLVVAQEVVAQEVVALEVVAVGGKGSIPYYTCPMHRRPAALTGTEGVVG